MMPRMPSTPRTMTMETTSGIGSLNGIAAQVRLPSISTPCSRRGRTPGLADFRFIALPRRLIDDAVEQFWIDRRVGRRRHGMARFHQFAVSAIVKRRARGAYLCDPGVKVAGSDRGDDEPHGGKAVAAELGGQSLICTRLVGQQVHMAGHP